MSLATRRGLCAQVRLQGLFAAFSHWLVYQCLATMSRGGGGDVSRPLLSPPHAQSGGENTLGNHSEPRFSHLENGYYSSLHTRS